MKEKFIILHGEDDEPDIEIVKRLIKKYQLDVEYHTRCLGQDVLNFILREDDLESCHQEPDLVLLDIGLPGINGIDVLKKIRSIEQVKHIPIIILSGSSSEKDFKKCIELGCNGYVQKNENYEDFSSLFKSIMESWIRIAQQKFV